jgi:hypothetical protein
VWKGATSRVMMVSRPKVSFWQDGSPSHGNYGWLFVFVYKTFIVLMYGLLKCLCTLRTITAGTMYSSSERVSVIYSTALSLGYFLCSL